MPQDHYIAKTYLRAFTDPQTNCLHAYSKRDSRYFTPSPDAVCKTMDWTSIPSSCRLPTPLGNG